MANKLHNRQALKERRRSLRQDSTPAEQHLWKHLRRKQLKGRKFRRQRSVGPYIVDFYCAAEKLIVELDGSVHDDPARRDYDEERTCFLENQGLNVVRFENSQVLHHLGEVLTGITQHFRD